MLWLQHGNGVRRIDGIRGRFLLICDFDTGRAVLAFSWRYFVYSSCAWSVLYNINT